MIIPADATTPQATTAEAARIWTFSLFWLPLPVARRAIDHGMGEMLDLL